MRAHRIRLLAMLALLVALDPASLTAGPPSSPPPTFLSLAFDQVDWMYGKNDPAKLNSLWGQMSFAYKAARKTWYLNGTVKLPGSRRQSWFLRNLPLDGERNATLRRKAVFLDLRNLGLKDGTDWNKVQYMLTLDTALSKKAPQAAKGPVTFVGTRERHVASVGPFDPGVPPRPILIVDRPIKTFVPRVVQPLQESEYEHRFAGAFARSLDWLNQTHKFDKNRTAKKILDDLIDEGIGKEEDRNGNGSHFDEWIIAKDVYALLLSGAKIKTSIWDGNNKVPDVQGLLQKKGDFLDWLDGEWDKNADVEIAVFHHSYHTFYTLTSFFRKGKDSASVHFRSDEFPGDDTIGDEFELVVDIYKGEDGTYRFSTDNQRIAFAISESVN